MRHIVAACLLLAAALPCHGQGKPNTLSAKEIADGWILLFDGETTFGWKIEGNAKAEAGVLRFMGDKAVSAWTSSYFRGFQIDFEYRQESKEGPAFRVWFRNQGVPEPGLGFFPAEATGWHRCTTTADIDPARDAVTFERKHYSPSGKEIHHSSSALKNFG